MAFLKEAAPWEHLLGFNKRIHKLEQWFIDTFPADAIRDGNSDDVTSRGGGEGGGGGKRGGKRRTIVIVGHSQYFSK